MKIRKVVKREDLIQLTDGETKESYAITAEDFSKNVSGNWEQVTNLFKALDRKVKLLEKKKEK